MLLFRGWFALVFVLSMSRLTQELGPSALVAALIAQISVTATGILHNHLDPRASSR